MTKLEEVSHKMLVLLRPRVSSRVSGFPVASPCLWGKLQNFSFSKVSKQVVMSFCVAGVALCDIPTCLITCRRCQNWRKPRTKCWSCCAHVSRLESLVFLWRRRVYGGTANLSFLKVSKQVVMSFCVAGQHFVTLQPVLYRVEISFVWLATMHSTLYTRHFTLHTLHSTLYTPHSTHHTPHSTLHTPHPTTIYTLHTPRSSLHTLHSTLHTLHFALHTLHFTLLTPHSTLYTLHSTHVREWYRCRNTWISECGVWSGKCRVWSAECKVRSVECKVWSGQCRV